MDTLPPVGIRGPEEGCAPEIAEDVEWQAALRRGVPRSGCQARGNVEVVEHIDHPFKAPTDAAEECAANRTVTSNLLFEKTEHAMSELFEAQPLNEVKHVPGDQSGGPVQDAFATPLTESGVWSREPTGLESRQPPGSSERGAGLPGPAWLYPKTDASGLHPSLSALHDPPDSLQHSKKRIASRWFALRTFFAQQDADRSDERVAATAKHRQAPIVAVFSIAGGAGKTSLVATLGRALSFFGERVLLSDTTSHGLLPFYFGASQLVAGTVRTFNPPVGSTDAPVQLLSYDAAKESNEEEGQAGIVDALLENSQRANRVLLDVGLNSSKIVNSLRHLRPTILVPVLPDMNSVISIDAVQKLFGSMLDAEGRPLQPVYLLNQFDASLPLHLDIREVFKQQVGERLLPFVIRRSAGIGEALAEGMTIVDYDAGSAVAEDYLRVANWLRSVTAPGAVGFRNQRWREQ